MDTVTDTKSQVPAITYYSKLKSSFVNKNSFLRHVIILTSGTVLAQLINVLTSPLITRLYSPEDMGGLTSILAITTMLGVIAAGRYELAIILPEKEKDATAIAFLGIGISFVFGFILTILFIFFGHFLTPILGMKNIPVNWTYILGLLVFFTGIQQVFTRTSIRNREFKVLATTQVTQTIGINSVKIGLGFLHCGVSGLFAGTLTGAITRSMRLCWAQRKHFFDKFNQPSFNDLILQAKRYKNFPLVSSWSALLNSASTQIPVVLFASLFSPAVAGYYALSYRILKLPIILIGQSVGNVFIDRAARARNNYTELSRITLNIYKKLLILGALSMTVFTFYGDLIFPFVFGKNWAEAGKYAQWISVWLIFVLASSPLSTLYSVLERQGEGLVFNLIMFISRVSIIWIGAFTTTEYRVIVYFSLIGALLWIVMCFRVLELAHVKRTIIISTTLYILIPIFAAQWLISFLIRGLICRL